MADHKALPQDAAPVYSCRILTATSQVIPLPSPLPRHPVRPVPRLRSHPPAADKAADSTSNHVNVPQRSLLRTRLDNHLTPHKTYLSLSRPRFLLLLLPSFLALILGLLIDLTHHSSSPPPLPLPASSGINTGDLTYYAPGLDACGWTSSLDDAIVAASYAVFDAAGGDKPNPNADPLCGKSWCSYAGGGE